VPENIVRFDGVWKQFRKGALHDSLRDLIPATLRRLTGREAVAAPEDRFFWALRDLSFDVKPGEVLGIIGPNGAGKSTTLKLLNRIMEPSRGQALVSGKIGALIEVSAGFHQDLTGRQNVFLQGSIMGMRKEEVKRKFDAIVEFAGVEDFIDTPVKRYSSGMNARLGFSIAAHLEPDVLIIDEVLAVGDHAFQTKAFGRIKAMANAGAPVILVSHQLDKVLEICTKAILLEHGQVRMSGSPDACVNEYLHGKRTNIDDDGSNVSGIVFHEMHATDGVAVRSGGTFSLVLRGSVDVLKRNPDHTIGLRVIEASSGRHRSAVLGRQRQHDIPQRQGEFEFSASMKLNVPHGQHYVEVYISDVAKNTEVSVGPRLTVEVLEGRSFWGDVQMDCDWSETTR